MKRIRRITALLLSFMMLFPTQGMTALADMGQVVVLPLEELDPGRHTEENGHIQETLPLEPLEDAGSLSGITAIYWNPGGSLPEELLATASNADPVATSSNMGSAAGTDKKFVAKGSDRADGYTPEHPVKSLETALKQADRLVEENGLDKSDITIYAMNPMEIPDGRMYVLNAGNIRIASWPGRTYNNDTIFYLNGGQLTLMNAVLEAGRESVDPEDAKLVHVKGGAMQLGRGVTIDGRIVMDYQKDKAQTEWEKASSSNAATPSDTSLVNASFAGETGRKSSASASNWTEAGQSGAGFDIDSYILNTEEDAWELLEDKSSASTWREPIIELIDGFDGLSEGYLLELRSDDDRSSVTLAKTLYADEATEEEFAGFFRLADTVSADWELRPLSERAATVRDTGAEELKKYFRSARLLSEDDGAAGTDGAPDAGGLSAGENVMTVKMLSASRASEKVIYWNPGPAFGSYPVGNDDKNSGVDETAPLKTLRKAREVANGATIVAMQTLDLGSENAGDYLGFSAEEDGAWKLPWSSMQTFRVFSEMPGPVFRVSDGKHLILENIQLEGILKNGELSEYKAIEVTEGGDLTIGSNVHAETGYIEIKASETLKNHPVHAESLNNVSVNLFFSGINDNTTYLYTDVVVPNRKLLTESATEEEKQALGTELLKRYTLNQRNKTGENGWNKWGLRPDTVGDDSQANPQNLELYTNVHPVGVYLDGINGNDKYAGTSYGLPVKTWNKAYEVWKKQMDKYKESGEPEGGYPNKIYICGTVTLDSGNHIWELEPYMDAAGNPVTSMVLNYFDISADTGGKASNRESIKTLVNVTGTASLTLKNIEFYNNSDLSDSRTIFVSGSGASVTLTGATRLTGRLDSTDPAQRKDITKGTHIETENGGSVNLDENWTGSIEGRQQGIKARGQGTAVSMKNGRIQNNDVYDPDADKDSQKRGAGVSLMAGASMTMDGGVIYGNKTFSYGGGIYLEGDKTTFTMKNGSIANNTVAGADAYTSYSDTVYGVGIYAGPGTTVKIEGGRVQNNRGYLVAGGGIYTEGDLVIKNAEVSDNRADVSFGGKFTGQDNMVRGVGICVASEGALQMERATVSGNRVTNVASTYEQGLGAGIYIGGTGTSLIELSDILNNRVGPNHLPEGKSQGGGIYFGGTGKLDINNSSIKWNRAVDGGGIGAYPGQGGTLTLRNCHIDENIATHIKTINDDPKEGTGSGGGIRFEGTGATMIMNGGTVSGNKANLYNGAIYIGPGTFQIHGGEIVPVKITDNLTKGIYIYTGGVVSGNKVEISGNEYGGIQAWSTANVYLRNGQIRNNKNWSGVYNAGGSLYFEDVKVEGNESAQSTGGGGIYLSSGRLYWSETSQGKSSLKDNTASGDGGGIACVSGQVFLDFDNEIKNNASGKGNNLYIGDSGEVYLFDGTLKQPDNPGNGVYNVYLNSNSGGSTRGLVLDAEKVKIEKRTDGSPEAIYLNTVYGYLRLLNSFPNKNPAEMPIDVNTSKYNIGNVVVRPENKGAVELYRPNTDLPGKIPYTKTYAPLKDASINQQYISGGTIPEGLNLGKMEDNTNKDLKNLTLIGAGIYLDGTSGNDDNSGLSPNDPVATFDRAKVLLREAIQKKHEEEELLQEKDRKGFAPYIYICGTVTVDGDADWELNYDDDLFKVVNIAYLQNSAEESADKKTAQVRRYPGFVNAPMIHVKDKATFNLGKIIVDGMRDVADISNQKSESPIIRIEKNAAVFLSGNTQLRNNYMTGIMCEGKLVLDGSAGDRNRQLEGIDGYAVELGIYNSGRDGGSLEMRGNSQIIVPGKPITRVIYGGVSIIRPNSSVTMHGTSSIKSASTRGEGYGISGSSYANYIKISMLDSATIEHVANGISWIGVGGEISMGASTEITAKNGIVMQNASNSYDRTSRLHMNGRIQSYERGTGVILAGNSGNIDFKMLGAIAGGSRGINVSGKNITVELENAKIENTEFYGIEVSTAGAENLKILLAGNSRISSAGYTGILFTKNSDGTNPTDQWVVQLEGNAQITGIGQPGSNYGYDGTGIKASGNGQIILKGGAKISQNKGYGIMPDYHYGTNIAVDLLENSEISENAKGGIVYPEETRLKVQVDVTVAGKASVKNNGEYQIAINEDSKVILKNQAEILRGASGGLTAILSNGPVDLDGTVTVDGMIALRNAAMPISLNTPIDAKTYKLNLVDGFLGKPVVIPGGEVSDASGYLSHFLKSDTTDTSVMVRSKNLAAEEKNIILEGENNVYLSGSGNDAGTGKSPSDPVRTFAKAKSLLIDEKHTEGANIYICGTTVSVTDEQAWSFDAGGVVTNKISGETWTPLVKRYDTFKTRMVSVESGGKLTLRNITLDGNKDKVQASDAMISVGSGGEMSFEEGAVIQNGNNMNLGQVSSGIHVKGGVLAQRGGIIRSMEIQGSSTDNPRAAAVYCGNSDNIPVEFEFYSGQIYDNIVYGDSKSIGAAVVIGENASFKMSGGSIHENRNYITRSAPDNLSQVKGAGIYIYRGLANIKGGTVRDNTSNVGSAIFYDDMNNKSDTRGVILSGGQVSDNHINSDAELETDGIYSPVYVNGPNFQLEGSGCNLSDRIYLAHTSNHIIVSGSINFPGRQYQVALNKGSGEGQFRKGSIIVAPDGSVETDVTPYLPYFTVISNPYVIDSGQSKRMIATNPVIPENACLLLMQAVYLDGERGSDDADGSTPKMAVKTFSEAKKIGSSEGEEAVKDYYIIYVCGKTANTAVETEWSMGTPAYMCRYTGFPVHGKDGTADKENRPYYGHLVEPKYNLTISSLRVYGRRSIDSTASNGESLFRIPADIRVTLQKKDGQEPVFGRNYNIGQYWSEDNPQANLSSRGGAFQIMPDGILEMSAGKIVESSATFGSAIYLGADETDGTKTGHLILSQKPSVNGTVYLDGNGTVSSAYIEPMTDYLPSNSLSITMKNAFNKRKCVQYPEGSNPGFEMLGQFSFEDSIYAMYNVEYNDTAKNVIELTQRKALYLDGVTGSDSNDGTTPEKAFQSLGKLYEHINAQQQSGGGEFTDGAVVYIVNTVKIGDGQKITLGNTRIRRSDNTQPAYKGSYQENDNAKIEIEGQVFFKRYVQPKTFLPGAGFEGYNRPTMKDELIRVEPGATLTLNGLYLDGHSNDTISGDKLYETEGVTANGPLVVVKGKLTCGIGNAFSTGDGIATATRFASNRNGHQKTVEIGSLNGSNIVEGSSAGIEVLDNGICELNGTEFINLELDKAVAGGTDIYHNGQELSVESKTLFSGSVFLEGLSTGDKGAAPSDSKYITVAKYGQPVQNDFQLLMRNPYKGRKMLSYPVSDNGPDAETLGAYRLEERIKEFYHLSKNATEPYIIELTVPSAIYISGDGVDDPDNPAAGSSPNNPVQSLKRAYGLLNSRGGNVISVVGTVQIDREIDITGTRYFDSTGNFVALSSTNRVNIVRYVQPDFAKSDKSLDHVKALGYDKEDFTGPLLNVKEGGRLIVGDSVHIDGHSERKDYAELPVELVVSRESISRAPLMTVEDGAEVVLKQGVTLRDNHNQYDGNSAGTEGGAIFNRGTVTVSGAMFENNEAIKGDAVYQAGIFSVESGISNLAGHSFYLASYNKGTDDNPNWEDHVIRIAEKIPAALTFDVDMDHAEAERDVIVFTSPDGYAPETGADAEHVRFRLGSTVPDNLFLVEAAYEPATLELQDWKTLHVRVPADIYLAVTRKGDVEGTTKLTAVRDGTGELFSTPEYQISNAGKYKVKVSVNGMENLSQWAGITDDEMSLKSSEAEVIGETDLYLAIKGLDGADSGGFTTGEIPLTKDMAASVELGQLEPKSSAAFGLTGKVGAGFVDKYKDPFFPLTGSVSEAKNYLNGNNTNAKVNAKAKYLLKYKVEMIR